MTFLHWRTKDVKSSSSIFASKRGLQVWIIHFFQWCIGLCFCIWKHNIWFYCLYSIPTIFVNSSALDKYLWQLVIAKDEQQLELLYFTICRAFSIDFDTIMFTITFGIVFKGNPGTYHEKWTSTLGHPILSPCLHMYDFSWTPTSPHFADIFYGWSVRDSLVLSIFKFPIIDFSEHQIGTN